MIGRRLVVLSVLALLLPATAAAAPSQPMASYPTPGGTLTITPPSDGTTAMTLEVVGYQSPFCSPAPCTPPYVHDIRSEAGWHSATGCTADAGDANLYHCAAGTTRPSGTTVTGGPAADVVRITCRFLSAYLPALNAQAGGGNDAVTGGCGADTLGGGDGADSLSGNAGADILAGGADDDRLEGGSGADTLDGGPGDDHLVGGVGTDAITGGDGRDTVSYADRSSAAVIKVNLDGTPTSGEAGEGDTIAADVENVIGSPGADDVTGTSAVNVIALGAGDDTVSVADGTPDFVDCGPGTDGGVADRTDILVGCENVQVPAAPDEPPAGTATPTPSPAPTPTPRVTASVDAQFAAAKRTRVLALRVLDPPAGARYELRCSGKRCFKGTRSTERAGGILALVRRVRFRPGQTLELRVLVTGQVGKVLRYTMRKRKPPAVALRCLPPGAAGPAAC